MSCGKQKRTTAAPARDLYTSPLFRKARAYAERSGTRWFVLSAKYGLVAPATVLEPYDLALAATPAGYRREWARRVVADLEETAGSLDGGSIEVHAGAAYADVLRPLLESHGAEVNEPPQGLRQGERLAWYGTHELGAAFQHPAQEASLLAAELLDTSSGRTASEFLATGGRGLRAPGLYS